MSYKNGIINHLIENEIEISFPDNDEATITQANIVSESMTLKQSICDSAELRFGGCIASEFNIKLMNTPERQFSSQLVGKWISVKITQHYSDPDELIYPSGSLYPSDSLYPGYALGSQSFYIFSGYIDSAPVDKADKNIFNIVAYDVLAKLYEADATNFLYSFFKTSISGSKSIGFLFSEVLKLSNNTVMTIPSSDVSTIIDDRYSVNGEQKSVSTFIPINEYWLERKDELSFGNLLKNICEVFAAFGFIIPDSGKGTFTLKKLTGSTEIYGFYEKLETEDFQSSGYTDFKFSVSGESREGKNVIHGGLTEAVDGAFEKVYDLTENALVLQPYTTTGQGRTSTDFDYLVNKSAIGTRLALNSAGVGAHRNQCAFSTYQPLSASLDARLWVTVGSPIEILVSKTDVSGNYIDNNGNIITDGTIVKESVKTYVLSRTITGIQAMTDKIEVKGVR